MKVREQLKAFGQGLYHDLGLSRFSKVPEKAVLDEPPPEPESLANLHPAGQSVRISRILEAKAEERKKQARADMLRRLAGEDPESIDTRPYECEGFFGVLDLLAPDVDNAIYPQILAVELFEPPHPHWDKKMVLMVVQRGIDTYRVALGFKALANPVVEDLKSAQLSAILTNEEKNAVREGRPLKLDRWTRYINPEEVVDGDRE